MEILIRCEHELCLTVIKRKEIFIPSDFTKSLYCLRVDTSVFMSGEKEFIVITAGEAITRSLKQKKNHHFFIMVKAKPFSTNELSAI